MLYWRYRRKFTILCSCLGNKCLGKQISDNTWLIIQLKFGIGISSLGKSSAWFYCYCKTRLIEMLVNVQLILTFVIPHCLLVLSMPDVWSFTFLLTLCYLCLLRFKQLKQTKMCIAKFKISSRVKVLVYDWNDTFSTISYCAYTISVFF